MIVLSGRAQNDVEPGRQFTYAGIFQWRELDRDRLARLPVSDSAINSVELIPRIPLNEELGCPGSLRLSLNLEMNMRRLAAVVSYRFYRAKVILPRRAGEEAPEPLKVGVELRLVWPVGQINAVAVHAPDFNRRVPHRFAPFVQQPSAYMRNNTNRRRN